MGIALVEGRDWASHRQADMGFYISFSGIVTFKSAKDLQAVALEVPLDRILIETDSPYLAPVPFRGHTTHGDGTTSPSSTAPSSPRMYV